MFDLYRVNPPLPRMVAATPILFVSHAERWTKYDNNPTGRSEILIGRDFLLANGSNSFWLFTVGRWACLPFTIIGMLTCSFWAKDLFGRSAGLLAATLWCFSPMMLGHGALVMPDVPAAALGLLACYTFWIWLKKPSLSATLACGVALGLAELTKFTWLILYPIFIGLWLLQYLLNREGEAPAEPQCSESEKKTDRQEPCPPVAHPAPKLILLLLAMAVSLLVINLGYAFTGTGRALGSFTFISRVLTGHDEIHSQQSGNRFAGTPLEKIPVPVPEDFLQGLDRQKADFDLPMWSYLRGQWKEGGWWYFYLYALVVKAPIGILLLGCLSVVALCRHGSRVDWASELCVLVPLIAITVLVSSQFSFSIHPRYALPAIPFAFVFISRVANLVSLRSTAAMVITTVCVVWSITSSLWIYPHGISYFNEFVGGPRNGHRHLLDSSIAWGQDILFLKEWYDQQPEARPLQIASFGWASPELADIDYTLPPLAPVSSPTSQSTPQTPLPLPAVSQVEPKEGQDFGELSRTGEGVSAQAVNRATNVSTKQNSSPSVSDNQQSSTDIGPQPGWYAIDVNHLQGTIWDAPTGKGGWQHFWINFGQPAPNFTYFQHFEPIDRVGYSYLIFHISREEANRVRRELNLPELMESNARTANKTSTADER